MFCLQNLILGLAGLITYALLSDLLSYSSSVTLKYQTIFLPLVISYKMVKCSIESFKLLLRNLQWNEDIDQLKSMNWKGRHQIP